MQVVYLATALAVLAAALWTTWRPEVEVPASSPIFSFEGLWHNGEADWPCTAVAFGVEAAKAGELRLRWTGPRALFRLTVQGGREQVTELWGGWLLGRNEVVVPIPDAGVFTVELRKLSGSHPLGTGWAALVTARWALLGVAKPPQQLKLIPLPRPERRIEFLASDMSCSSFGVVAKELKASYQLQALEGVAVVRNAGAEWLVGSRTWTEYQPRLLASREATGRRPRAQLVVVNLGGDDLTEGVEHTFRVVYNKLLRGIIAAHGGFKSGLSILATCGGRCAACGQVEKAVQRFHESVDLYAENATVRLEYLALPCGRQPQGDGEVVRRTVPKIRAFMAW